MKKYLSLLEDVKLFSDIEKDQIGSLLSCLNASKKHFKRGEFILQVGEEIHSVGIILNGVVEIIKEDYFGNRNIISILKAGELFGEVFACANINNSPVSAVANTKTTILTVDFNRIVNTCSVNCSFHNQLVFNMLKIIAQKNLVLSKKIDQLNLKTLRAKISFYLLEQRAIHKSNSFAIPLDRAGLADYLNTDRSALSRELSKMKKEKIIDFHKHSFKILDLEAIKVY